MKPITPEIRQRRHHETMVNKLAKKFNLTQPQVAWVYAELTPDLTQMLDPTYRAYAWEDMCRTINNLKDCHVAYIREPMSTEEIVTEISSWHALTYKELSRYMHGGVRGPYGRKVAS